MDQNYIFNKIRYHVKYFKGSFGKREVFDFLKIVDLKT